LLGLDVALTVQALRRVTQNPPALTLPAADRVAFARTVALLSTRNLRDASRESRPGAGGRGGPVSPPPAPSPRGRAPGFRAALAWAGALK
jgi:hypothetical protein